MANKSEEEIIKKPTASRGRPRKDAQASKTKKTSKSKKKTTKKSSSSKKSVSKKAKSTTLQNKKNVELINDVQIENTLSLTTISDEIIKSEPVETSVVENNLETVIQQDLTSELENTITETEENNPDVQEIEKEILNSNVEEHNIESSTVPIVNEDSTIEKTKKKRTIKNISIKRPSPTIEETSESEEIIETQEIEEKPINEEVVVTEKVIELPKREKRTLRLNLGSKKQEQVEPSYKKDESINQNSAFFNEPSIFAKFNIDITNTENEENLQEQNDIIEESSTSEEDSQEIIEPEKNYINELPAEQLDELICEAITNTILEEPTPIQEEISTSEDLIDETIEQVVLEEIAKNISDETIEQEIKNSEILKSVRSILGGKLGSLDELNSDEEIISQEESQEEFNETPENVILFKNLVEDEENIENNENNFSIADQKESDELKEAADTISNQEQPANTSPIGKFFDSSIPSMTSTVNNTFSKIKKSIFSNISPIFKKFTFEEATLRTHQDEFENNFNEPENNLSDIQKALENFSPNVQEANNISGSISDIDIQAESVLSIPVIETNTIVSTKQEELIYENPELNIITPASDSSFEEEFLENEETTIYDESEEIDEIDEVDEVDNIDTVDEVDEINIDETANNIENVEEEYNDEEFSIESYFGIDNVSLEEKDLKSIKNISEEIEEESTESENSTSTPEEFVDKFLETNPIAEVSEEQNIEEENSSEEQEEILSDELNPEQFVDKLLEDNTIQEKISEQEILEQEIVNTSSVEENQETELQKVLKEKDEEISNLSKLLESFTQTISTLTNRITDLENKQSNDHVIQEEISENPSSEIIENLIEESQPDTQSKIDSNNTDNEEIQNQVEEEINIDDIDINDLDLNDLDLENLELSEEVEEPSLLVQEKNENYEDEKTVESILSEVLLSKDLDSDLKDELLSEVLSYEENLSSEDLDESLLEAALLEELSDEDLLELEKTEETTSEQDALSDFSKIIDSLTKAITELEQTPDIKQETQKINNSIPLAPLPAELTNYSGSEDKAINILINKDDTFSISILNETYEIVADFDGISVLSENLHISTPKNNFFVKVGNKYIEIHNKKDNFILNTNFEDIEFANAINNIAFTKKNNKIELNIKEAFKLSSVNNKIELSMLNKAIADLSAQSQTNEPKDESSICDNKTLLISEETQKVYLPYTIEDVMKKLKSSDEYQTVQEIVDNEYTLPLSTFKMPIISRFKEAYRFMRTKENSSVYAAVDLALELMFNSNLNPAVIRAAKDMKELNIYLDCLYENEVEKFDCFKIVYKVLPKIK